MNATQFQSKAFNPNKNFTLKIWVCSSVDRARGYEPRGRGFESLLARKNGTHKTIKFKILLLFAFSRNEVPASLVNEQSSLIKKLYKLKKAELCRNKVPHRNGVPAST